MSDIRPASHDKNQAGNITGSIWNRWNPHIHTPGTVLNDNYNGDNPWDDFLTKLEQSAPIIRALGITDYYGIETYEAVLVHKKAGRLKDVELIFPNIELRLDVGLPKGSGINFHLLCSPDDPNHVHEIKRFLLSLEFHFGGEKYRCDRADLIKLGKAYDRTITDDNAALKAGTEQFKVDHQKLIEAYNTEWARNNIIFAVSASSNDGTAALQKDAAFTATRQNIEKSAHIIFSANPSDRKFWLGKGSVDLEQLTKTWGGLKPCLHGCDAHEYDKVGAPHLDRFCWIKGDLTFESLRQACIEPNGRVFVGATPPRGGLPSHTITQVSVPDAPWFKNASIPLNPGLVAIIGARGSGKTALTDLIAAGSYALDFPLDPKSFIHRAQDYIAGANSILSWENGKQTSVDLGDIETSSMWEESHVQYLSQQFVDQLCSSEGLNERLLEEVERVVFQVHPVENRMDATNFQELLNIVAYDARAGRQQQEENFKQISSDLARERVRKANLETLTKQNKEKEDSIAKDINDRKTLTGNNSEERSQRLEAVARAVDTITANVNEKKRQYRAIAALQTEIAAIKKNLAEKQLKDLKSKHPDAKLDNNQWDNFQLVFKGDVDSILQQKMQEARSEIDKLGGSPQPEVDMSIPPSTTPYVTDDCDLLTQPLVLVEGELTRLRRLAGIDEENSKKLARLSDKITRDQAALANIEREIELAKQADGKIKELVAARKVSYAAIFDAIIDEEKSLAELYAPLKSNLQNQTGTVGKLSFTVRRNIDVKGWAEAGEALLDLRKGGSFRGKGQLQEIATKDLLTAWEKGTSAEIANAWAEFSEKYSSSFIEHAPVEKTDKENYARWVTKVSDWLYSTEHVSISYGIEYDNVDIKQLSSGTRGIVLLLLYLAIDKDDVRPLIIDQPEENLDPKSVFDELVGCFKEAKIRRQIIIVTHNANLVVNTDADQVIIASCGAHRPGELPVMSYESGGLEDAKIRKHVCEILEGGENAFKERAKRLRVAI